MNKQSLLFISFVAISVLSGCFDKEKKAVDQVETAVDKAEAKETMEPTRTEGTTEAASTSTEETTN